MQPVKNKKLTYLLLIAVAAVWGIVIYRLFFMDPAGDYKPQFAEVEPAREPFDQYTVKPDTFKLSLKYRDPFLGGIYKDPEVNTAVIPVIPVAVKPLPPPINWGSITYSGCITNPQTKKVVSIVSVNGNERMISEGEVFEGVKLLKNKRDSILVEWLGKQKYIKQ